MKPVAEWDRHDWNVYYIKSYVPALSEVNISPEILDETVKQLKDFAASAERDGEKFGRFSERDAIIDRLSGSV